jgi:hypothetical protein
MAPSTEGRLPFEGLICHASDIFPVAGSASDDHHSLVLLIGDPLVAALTRTGVPANVRFTPNSGHWNRHVYHLRRDNSGSLAMFAAIHRASSRLNARPAVACRALNLRSAAEDTR